ncbi:MAG: sugar phosphate isomerase/epimerase [Armatimonadetes bacterium]|nr:sugar phosphate isomerase/epimerase [Armatimonadota bacterium]
MFSPKLGVSLATVHNEITDELLEAVKASKITTLELFWTLFEGEGAESRKAALKAMLSESGIRAMTIHAPFGSDFDLSSLDTERRRSAVAAVSASIDLAVEMGAPMVVVHASSEPIGPEERPLRMAQAQDSLRELAEKCESADRRIAIELLPRTCLGNNVEELLAFLEDLPPSTAGVCLDTNHQMGHYKSLPEWIRRLGSRLIATHLSDYDGVDEQHWLPGKGVVDWQAVVKAFQDIGYPGPMNYESAPDGETIPERIRSLERNFDWLISLERHRF